MARSEYSRLRGIAERRLSRLESAGLVSGDFHFPKVSELKSAKAREQALANLQDFLSGGTKLREVKESGGRVVAGRSGGPRVVSEEEARRIEQRERRNAQARMRRAERKQALAQLSKDQKAMLKGAKTAGLVIKTKDIDAFIEYAEYRLSQNKDSSWYTIVDDFEKIQKKKAGVRDIVSDFARFKADRDDLLSAPPAGGYSSMQIDSMWSDFINQI